MSSALPERKPWSMKWIVAAIVLFIGVYTYLTLHFRKPTRAYEPYHDMKVRANTARLLAAGYQRIELTAQRPADVAAATNTALPAPGGLPEGLRATLVSSPLLPTDVVEVHAPSVTSSGNAYQIQFRCTTPDEKEQFARAELYIHGDEIVITPNFERLSDGLQARTRESLIVLTVPEGTLKPGAYRVTLTGERLSRAWMLQVK